MKAAEILPPKGFVQVEECLEASDWPIDDHILCHRQAQVKANLLYSCLAKVYRATVSLAFKRPY